MRWGLALAVVAVAGTIAWAPVRNAIRGYHSTEGAKVVHFTLRSRLLHRKLGEILVTPAGGGRGRPLLVWLHGRSAPPSSSLSDSFFRALRALGARAPNVLLANGGDHSYWHDRGDGKWGTSVLREAIPAALARSHADARRVAIGGISMGGFGALDLGRQEPKRFCAVGGHSPAIFARGSHDIEFGFVDAADFAKHDLLGIARDHSPYRGPVWIDIGLQDELRPGASRLARELKSDGTDVTFHMWPGAHTGEYWDAHFAQYLRFYADACG